MSEDRKTKAREVMSERIERGKALRRLGEALGPTEIECACCGQRAKVGIHPTIDLMRLHGVAAQEPEWLRNAKWVAIRDRVFCRTCIVPTMAHIIGSLLARLCSLEDLVNGLRAEGRNPP